MWAIITWYSSINLLLLFLGVFLHVVPAITIGATFPTLIDVVKRLDPGGGIQSIVEALNKYNPILDQVAFIEGNLMTGHQFTARTALPSVTWRRLNEGVNPTKSATEQTTETCGMMEDYSKIDVDVAKMNGNELAFRASEDVAFLQAFNIEFVNALLYYSTTVTPERVQGLTPRLNQTAANPASAQIIKADPNAAGNNQTSIWLIGWSPETIFGIYPKGSLAGFVHEDLGRQLVLDANNKQFLAWVSRYQWKLGFCVRDSRFLARICNIDTTRWKEDLSSGADIALRMQDAIAALFNLTAVSPCWYMARQTFNMLNKQLMKRQANWLEWINITPGGVTGNAMGGGQRIPAFMGIPIYYLDGLLYTEPTVV